MPDGELAAIPGVEVTEHCPSDGSVAEAEREKAKKDAAAIKTLAGLPPLDYDRRREAEAEKLRVRVGTLDGLVQAERAKNAPPPESAPGQGRPLKLPEPAPWPEPVDGAALLDGIVAVIQRFVVLTIDAARATALWVLGTYLLDAFVIFPRLAVTSPEMGCGKSTLFDVIGGMVLKRILVSNVTVSALFRAIEIARPTLLLDEADTFLPGNEEMRGILNAGHRRDGTVLRSVGEDFEPREFSVYAASAIASIGKVPSTIEDRSIHIRLRRRRPDEAVEDFRADRTEALDRLASMAAKWVADHGAEITAADPEMPKGIFNRVADNWRPLLAIADAAGGEWPALARKVAENLAAAIGDDASIRVALLADISDVFADKNEDEITSAAMVEALVKLEGHPWAEIRHGKELTPNTLARMLKPFGIGPENISIGPKRAKGYRARQFEDAFGRYLLPPSNQSVHPYAAAESCGSPGDEQPYTGFNAYGLKPSKNGAKPPQRTDVRIENSQPGEKEGQGDEGMDDLPAHGTQAL